MTKETKLLDWWESLEEIWKDIFSTQIQINATIFKIGVTLKKDLSDDEKKLAEINEDFEKNNSEIKNIALINLIQSEKIIIGRTYEFILENLDPLSYLKNLNKIRFNNCKINDFKKIEELKNLKKLEFHNVQINANSSSVFSNINDVEIYFEKSSILKL